jgi:hypothetical protein
MHLQSPLLSGSEPFLQTHTSSLLHVFMKPEQLDLLHAAWVSASGVAVGKK